MGSTNLVTMHCGDKLNRLMVAPAGFGFLEFAVQRILAETTENKAATTLCGTVGMHVEIRTRQSSTLEGPRVHSESIGHRAERVGQIALCVERRWARFVANLNSRRGAM
jgi:hypothetical protein